MHLRILAIVSLVLLTHSWARAQEPTDTFDQLGALVKPGETLTITDSMGKRTRGKLTDLSTTSLMLDVSRKSHAFAPADIDTIEKRDSLGNGALIGFAIGAGLASILGFTSSEARDEGAALILFGALVYGGAGAGIGVGIDALGKGLRVIYKRRPAGSSGEPAVVRERSN